MNDYREETGEPNRNENWLKRGYRAWRDYPIHFFEKARETDNFGYILIKNAIPFIEGVAAGGLLYYFTGDESSFALGPIAAMTIRHLQTRNYIVDNYMGD